MLGNAPARWLDGRLSAGACMCHGAGSCVTDTVVAPDGRGLPRRGRDERAALTI